MTGDPGGGLEQEGPAGDGFSVLMGIGQAHEETPPVVGQGGESRHEAAALEVAGGEATPAPVIFQFIKGIFRIGAVAVPLGEGQDLLWQRGDQHGVSVDDDLLVEVGKAQAQLVRIPVIHHRRIALDPLSPRHEMHGIGATLTQPMAYATIPRLNLEGMYGDEKISGTAWFDHQWGSACWFLTQPSGGMLNGWDWVSINGDDGSDWIFLSFHDMKSKKTLGRYAIRYELEKKPVVFQDFEAIPVRFWESERTHISYPVSWILKIPEISAEITINPVTDDQEIPVLGFMRAVWEGAATSTGTVNNRPFTGRARLELQGYGYIFDFGEYLGRHAGRQHAARGRPRT